MITVRAGLALLLLATLLNGCASAIGNADAGPDPGGGFYKGSNMNVGHVDPVAGNIRHVGFPQLGQVTW
jgi:hypothetical protein